MHIRGVGIPVPPQTSVTADPDGGVHVVHAGDLDGVLGPRPQPEVLILQEAVVGILGARVVLEVPVCRVADVEEDVALVGPAVHARVDGRRDGAVAAEADPAGTGRAVVVHLHVRIGAEVVVRLGGRRHDGQRGQGAETDQNVANALHFQAPFCGLTHGRDKKRLAQCQPLPNRLSCMYKHVKHIQT